MLSGRTACTVMYRRKDEHQDTKAKHDLHANEPEESRSELNIANLAVPVLVLTQGQVDVDGACKNTHQET